MTTAAVLEAYRCRACSWLQFSGRRCDRCRGAVLGAQVEPVGNVVAVTVLERVPPGVLCSAPYAIALVQLTDGPELLAISDASEDLRVADAVEIERVRVDSQEESTWTWTAKRRGSVGSGA
jgi:uncharacterized OB-fold protein